MSDVVPDPELMARTHKLAIWRLEKMLAAERTHSVKATRQLHRAMGRDLKDAEMRASRAEQKAARLEKQLKAARTRARQAEQELETLKASTTWKAGRAVIAVPARIKRWGR